MKPWKKILILLPLLALCMANDDCGSTETARSSSGLGKASVKVPVGSDGLTAEQRNIRDRLAEDNKPGSIKHLYVISAYSGQVLIYSTVRGKVTSGGKRLTPTSIYGGTSNNNYTTFGVDIDGKGFATTEVLQDDGTYGSSGDYLYWWDTKGVYHQHYVAGGQIVHVSNQPLAVKSVVINMEETP
jgi:hypothetical protein